MSFHFIRPLWLLLVPVVVAVWWIWHRRQDPLRGWRTVVDHDLLEAMTVGENPGQLWWSVGLLLAWLLAVVAVAGPTFRPEPSPFADDPIPVMIVLRASESMDLTDLVPSRMERARLKIADFAHERRGQPMGLIAYAGSAHLVLPPTRDTSVVATMAGEISPAILPKPGDDLAAALHLAEQTLGETGGSIVVVADSAGDVPDAAKVNVPIYILAIARPDTPELEAIRRVASQLGADVTVMTPDAEDVRSLASLTAKAPVAVAATDAGTHWEEAGWFLVPLLAVLSLLPFRRIRNAVPEEMDA